tara:strand:- start:203 stop:931 length:729 start_codon:yes stop_codon:yes gene_type:complete
MTVLIIGGRSDIGIAIAHRFAKEGFNIQLAARNSFLLEKEKKDLEIRYGITVTCHEFDGLDLKSHENFIQLLTNFPSIVISTIGYLGEQKKSEKNLKETLLTIRTNFESVVSILGLFANHFERKGSGTIIAISSVAGDRGRASNYLYGASKAGLTTFLSGLRNRLQPYGVNVITIKPGFVKTKMTAEIDLPGFLTTTPKKVADYVFKAYKSDKKIVYVTSRWFLIMTIIKAIPEKFFMRLKF